MAALSANRPFSLAVEEDSAACQHQHHQQQQQRRLPILSLLLRSRLRPLRNIGPVFLPSLRQRQTQLAMDNSGKEKEAMQLMAEADKKVKASGSFLGGMFG